MASRQHSFRRKVWLAAELNDSMSDLIRVGLFLVFVLKKLGRDALSIYPLSHEEMPLIPKDAHDLGCERFVQNPHHRLAVRGVAFGHRPVLDMTSRSLSNCFDVG